MRDPRQILSHGYSSGIFQIDSIKMATLALPGDQRKKYLVRGGAYEKSLRR
jgi:hypothetical protein